MMKFVEHRVTDKRILRLISKWLKAGVSEEGKWLETTAGTPQGAVISPLLANVYLHYVFDLWVEAWRRKVASGEMVIVRYADDLVVGFEQRADAERFLSEFRERLASFALELHPEKTRLIEFGRFAQVNRRQRGEGNPETFTFLGFTHYCATNSKGHFVIRRKTMAQRMRATLHAIKAKLRQRMHEPVNAVGAWLKRVVSGYYQYHAVPETSGHYGASVIGCAICGGRCLADAVSAAVPAGPAYARPSNDGYHDLVSCILTRTRASTLLIQGRSRVR
jgi:RNA-directed DNA polymerase